MDVDLVSRLKEAGNKEFGLQHWSEAESLYSDALVAADYGENSHTEPLLLSSEVQALVRALFSNRCLTRLQLKKNSHARDDAGWCVRLASDWDKGEWFNFVSTLV